jgi:hypothetical protein
VIDVIKIHGGGPRVFQRRRCHLQAQQLSHNEWECFAYPVMPSGCRRPSRFPRCSAVSKSPTWAQPSSAPFDSLRGFLHPLFLFHLLLRLHHLDLAHLSLLPMPGLALPDLHLFCCSDSCTSSSRDFRWVGPTSSSFSCRRTPSSRDLASACSRCAFSFSQGTPVAYPLPTVSPPECGTS